jgi:hypothetical protein
MTVEQYLNGIAQHFVHELEPILGIKEVTQNTDLLGSYAEAAIRRLVARVVHPMRVSTGAVIDYPMPSTLRQIDAIVWAPFPAPGLFDVDAFALVPRSSAFGIMEIKRSNYSGVDEMLEDFVAHAPELAATAHPQVPDTGSPGLGVVCVLEGKPSARLSAMIGAQRAVAIFEKVDNMAVEASVRPRDVLKLINFLHYIGWRYRMQASQINYPQLLVSG